MPTIKFTREKKAVQCERGANLRQAAMENGVQLYHGMAKHFNCRGKSLCGECRVHVIKGMERTLKENACYLQVELYSDRLEELKGVFAQLGYRFLHTEDIDHFFTNMPDTT